MPPTIPIFYGAISSTTHRLHLPQEHIHILTHPYPTLYRDQQVHIDGTLAPRIMLQRKQGDPKFHPDMYLPTKSIFHLGISSDPHERTNLIQVSNQLPEGQFLHHYLDNGYSAISWWGKRPMSNSTILAKGKHSSATLLALLADYFPTVNNIKFIEV